MLRNPVTQAVPASVPSRFSNADGFFCALAVIAVALCTVPFAELGFDDDWSYVKSAQVFAQTGRFVYNGWATAMLGWQIPWGALFIKIFGFSFTATRASTLVSTFVAIWLFHTILRRFGLNRENRIFGCLLLGLSPLFIPLVSSFMTDVNGVLIVLLCLYMCMRAFEAPTRASAFWWLIAAAGVNVIGGTARQIAWLGALALVPSTAWLIRARRGAIALGITLWLASVASIYGITAWWNRQPGAMREPPLSHTVWAPRQLPHIASYDCRVFLQLCLVLWPLLAAWLPHAKAFSAKTKVLIAASLVLLAVLTIPLAHRGILDLVVAPWMWHLIGEQGFFAKSGLLLGSRPVTVSVLNRTILSLAIVATLLVFGFAVASRRVKSTGKSSVHGLTSWHVILTLTLPFLLGFVILLTPRTFNFLAYDRYLLSILPLIEICLLKYYQENWEGSLPAISYAVLAVMAGYSVAATHDWIAGNRAILHAADTIMATGVSRTSIEGGWSFDGWTQIEATGFMNDSRIQHAPYDSHTPDLGLPPQCTLSPAAVPVVRPKYFFSTEPLPCLAPSKFGSFTYGSWLPPYHRAVYVLQRP